MTTANDARNDARHSLMVRASAMTSGGPRDVAALMDAATRYRASVIALAAASAALHDHEEGDAMAALDAHDRAFNAERDARNALADAALDNVTLSRVTMV